MVNSGVHTYSLLDPKAVWYYVTLAAAFVTFCSFFPTAYGFSTILIPLNKTRLDFFSEFLKKVYSEMLVLKHQIISYCLNIYEI